MTTNSGCSSWTGEKHCDNKPAVWYYYHGPFTSMPTYRGFCLKHRDYHKAYNDPGNGWLQVHYFLYDD